MDDRVCRLSQAMRNLGNAERVVEQVLPLEGMPSPVEVPDSKVTWILKPFDLSHWMRRSGGRRFEINLGAKPEGVEEFWVGLQGTDAGREFWRLHPWLGHRTPWQLRFHLPLMFFDDFGPVTSTRSTMARVWYSLLGVGSERECRYLLGTGLKDDSLEDKSWSVIMQSFEDLSGPLDEGSWGAYSYLLHVIWIMHVMSWGFLTSTVRVVVAQTVKHI